MKSTGEVMGIGPDFAGAFTRSQLGAGITLPRQGAVFISVKDEDKPDVLPICRDLKDLGFTLIATGGTADALNAAGIETETVNKVMQGVPMRLTTCWMARSILFSTPHRVPPRCVTASHCARQH